MCDDGRRETVMERMRRRTRTMTSKRYVSVWDQPQEAQLEARRLNRQSQASRFAVEVRCLSEDAAAGQFAVIERT
jgi:transposase